MRQTDRQESPDDHIRALNEYITIAQPLLPSISNKHALQAILWHPDLHTGNIFVDGNKISSIIDWQGCPVRPAFYACTLPKFLTLQGNYVFEIPAPSEFSSMPIEQKKEIFFRYALTECQKMYVAEFNKFNNKTSSVLSLKEAAPRRDLIELASDTWDGRDGLSHFNEVLLHICEQWSAFSQEKCPITFDEHEIRAMKQETKDRNDIRQVFDELGIPEDGWVHADDFEQKRQVLQVLSEEILATAPNRDEAAHALTAWGLTGPGPASLTDANVVKF